jgi:hypothetical protein
VIEGGEQTIGAGVGTLIPTATVPGLATAVAVAEGVGVVRTDVGDGEGVMMTITVPPVAFDPVQCVRETPSAAIPMRPRIWVFARSIPQFTFSDA